MTIERKSETDFASWTPMLGRGEDDDKTKALAPKNRMKSFAVTKCERRRVALSNSLATAIACENDSQLKGGNVQDIYIFEISARNNGFIT